MFPISYLKNGCLPLNKKKMFTFSYQNGHFRAPELAFRHPDPLGTIQISSWALVGRVWTPRTYVRKFLGAQTIILIEDESLLHVSIQRSNLTNSKRDCYSRIGRLGGRVWNQNPTATMLSGVRYLFSGTRNCQTLQFQQFLAFWVCFYVYFELKWLPLSRTLYRRVD